MVYIFTLTHYAIGGVAVQYLHLQGSPPLQHISAVWSCCFRLPLFRGAPSLLSTSSCSVFFTRTMVHVRRVRRCVPPDPVPSVLFKVAYASTSSTLAGACWWIPTGGEVQLCCRPCREFRSAMSGFVLFCQEWVRYSRQLALKVSGLTLHDMVAQVSSRTPSRRQRWTFLAPKLCKFWGLCFFLPFRGPCGSGFSGFPLPGVSCGRLVFWTFHSFLGSVERFRNGQRQLELMSDRVRSSFSMLVSAIWKSKGIDFHESDRDHFSSSL